MQFSIIGTGNMAWFLAHKLTIAGHQCTHVYGRDIAKARQLADVINSRGTDRLRDIGDSDDAIIISVSDSHIADISSKLIADNAVVIHTSGFISAEALKDARRHAVLWPIYSILKHNLPTHRNIPCAIEAADLHSRLIVKNLAHAFTDIVFEATLGQRQWLHIAAVIGNKFINHLMTLDEVICREQGLDFNLLKPILQQTMERIQANTPSEMQTGPAVRNDEATIHAQMELLKKHPHMLDVYQAITKSIRAQPAPIHQEKAANN